VLIVAGASHHPSLIDRNPGVHAILVMVAFDVVDQFVSPGHIQQRTDCYQQTKPFARLFGVSEQFPPHDYQASRPIFGACCTT
jgi:uncharacterized protein (DUF2236 family)